MIYTANQPLFFPHIYMLNRYANVTALVHMNDAQFTKFGHQSRVELLDKHGKEVLLVVPLKDRNFKRLNEVEVADVEKTIRKIQQTLQMLYGRYDAYKALEPSLTEALCFLSQMATQGPITLASWNGVLFRWLKRSLNLKLEEYDSPVIVPKRPENPSEWVAAMGAAINCKTYLGGKVAQEAYIREEDFSSRGMTFVAQNYKMKPYRRYAGAMSDRATVSVLDPLFIGGPDLVHELIDVAAF